MRPDPRAAANPPPRTHRFEDCRTQESHRQDDRRWGLPEFPSAVEAFACAVAVQRGMAERVGPIPNDQRIDFRVASTKATSLDVGFVFEVVATLPVEPHAFERE